MKTILLFDSDEDVIAVITTILDSEGYNVVAINHTVATSEVERIHPDLILVDDYLYEDGGEKLCSLIKHNYKTKNIPVVLFSTSFNIKRIAAKCGADYTIEKPFDIDYLIDNIKTISPIN